MTTQRASSQRRLKLAIAAMALGSPALAQENAMLATQAFSQHCFSPYLTAQTAAQKLAQPGVRHDFYDLDPFSNVAPSPAQENAVAPGTDRRCEVAFDGAAQEKAGMVVAHALIREGITDPAPVPATYTRTNTTALLAARYLNPNRIAVVIVGTRPGPNGVETHMTVERLLPLTN